MKFIFTILILSLMIILSVTQESSSGSNGIIDDTIIENDKYSIEFIKWTHKYNKKYSSDEFNSRFEIFKNNIQTFVTKNENQLSTSKLGINQFSDLTLEEFTSIYLSNPVDGTFENENTTSTIVLDSSIQIPTSFDWRDLKDVISSVKDQGECGSGYAFAAIGAIKGSSIDLSEQNLVDCSIPNGNGGCNGGYIKLAYEYMMVNGVNQEYYYPYIGEHNQCTYLTNDVNAKLSGYVKVSSVDELLQTVATVGPVAISFDASTIEFMGYIGGIYNSESCNPSRTAHSGVVVGYGTDANGIDYWIVKSSFSVNWGEQGYFRLARSTSDNVCGVISSAYYPL